MEDMSSHEESLFLTTITPLKLVMNDKVVWTNPKPSSCHFTRPLHLQYKKETKDAIVQEEASLKEEINGLNDLDLLDLPEDYQLNGFVKYNAEITMLDGKVVNAITDTKSSQSCNVCAASPKEMNNLPLVRSKPINKDSLKLGISPLHMQLRSFEFLLHLGYKMDNKTFYAKSPSEKASVESRKNEIRKKFREELSLVVDTPRQGFGTSNTGNVAHRAFENSDVFAEINGVDQELIERLRTILKAINSGC